MKDYIAAGARDAQPVCRHARELRIRKRISPLPDAWAGGPSARREATVRHGDSERKASEKKICFKTLSRRAVSVLLSGSLLCMELETSERPTRRSGKPDGGGGEECKQIET